MARGDTCGRRPASRTRVHLLAGERPPTGGATGGGRGAGQPRGTAPCLSPAESRVQKENERVFNSVGG